MSNYDNLKEILQAGPSDLNSSEVLYVMWVAREVIETQERLIREYEHHIDNDLTIMEIERKCHEREYYSTSRRMDS